MMKRKNVLRFGALGAVLVGTGLLSFSLRSDPVFFAGTPATIAQVPLYVRDSVAPLNMLVMGKDHKIYYEAYNDASDLNDDGVVDVGYVGWKLRNPAPDPESGLSRYEVDYYGYFNSYACYAWQTNRFEPTGHTDTKKCSNAWSGDYLNYLTMSRMDVLRRVLYGGWRQVDTVDETVLQGAFFPQDAHSWGKEYHSVARDGYSISDYTPLRAPTHGRYHLFAVTTVTDSQAAFPGYTAPLFRFMENSPFRVWNWLSIEGPVAGNSCFTQNNNRVDCVNTGMVYEPVPASMFKDLTITTWKRTGDHPDNRAQMDALFNTHANASNFCGSGPVANIDVVGPNNNPFAGNNGCGHDNYLTRIEGKLVITESGNYRFGIDGDDAVDVRIGNAEQGWYGGHGNNRGNVDAHAFDVNLPAGEYDVLFRHEETGGDDNWGLLWQVYAGAQRKTDYAVRVLACPENDTLREGDASCKVYPNGKYKPTGILHDYGESQRMYFGLITGSQRNNLEGGILRRNVSNFAEEVNPTTGVFRADVEGVVRSIDRLRMIGGGYDDSTTNNLGSDSNWNWATSAHGVGGNCESQGGRTLRNGECRMWGNPIAEMMYESVRYFAGASAGTPSFAQGGSSQGETEDTRLGLAAPEWKDPYVAAPQGGGYPSCARPVQTVISDINPSYDGNLPGTAFSSDGDTSNANVTVDVLTGFDAAALGQQIWDQEFGGSREVFIGEVGATTDGAPTAKAASSFGNIRGLAPEEPTKQGTYYAASVARYAANRAPNSLSDADSLTTMAVALASPLPRMLIPVGGVGGAVVELLPFAKTVSGTFGGSARKPTNTIVDFYVESIVNFSAQDFDGTVNSGRPRAVFRINYEDVEQGNDHDMDMIVRYEILANADSTITVNLTSEYAAGSANQNAGYIISGTTNDGVYLEVRDSDSGQDSSRYELNTPAGVWAGGCVGAMSSAPCNVGLTLNASRTFSLGSSGSAMQLRDPLWYAAKYGSRTPDIAADGEPNNYFLVTNPLNMRAQLAKAFDSALDLGIEAGSAVVSGARVGASSFTLEPTFRRARNGNDWTGNLTAIRVNADGSLGLPLWSAAAGIPAVDQRNIRTLSSAGSGTSATAVRSEFRSPALPGDNASQLDMLGGNTANRIANGDYGAANYTAADLINYIRGDQTREASQAGAANTLRTRSSVLGSIINSEPVVAAPSADYGYGNHSDSMFSGYARTAANNGYLNLKASRKTVAYVGANDGMLHAFDAGTVPCPPPNQAVACPAAGAGTELFAFIPNGVLGQLGAHALPDGHFSHRYYVDGQLSIGDVKDGNTWKTILVGSAGGGARSIFALDVSNPTSAGFTDSSILWERNNIVDNDIGHIYGKPLIVPLENGRWGVLFGNGYGGNNSDPSLYILDAMTGEVIRKLTANDGHQATTSTGTPAEWVCEALNVEFCARKTDPFNGLGQITAIDKNGNGKVDFVYGGDLQGNVWKFDLSAASDTGWSVANAGAALFTAEVDGERQPITGGIRIAAGPGTGVMVYFGTGRYLFDGDNNVAPDPTMQSLYAVFDNDSAVAGGRAALRRQTITGQTAPDADGVITRSISRNRVTYFGTGSVRGWYLDLAVVGGSAAAPVITKIGERFIATPRIQSGRVFFTTFTPAKDSCNPGGDNFVYALDLLSGSGALTNVAVQPSNTPACVGADCGAISIQGGGAPVTSTSEVAINPVKPVPGLGAVCDPAVENCPTFEECQVVIYPGAFVLPRPCGRQSWRQLR